MYPDMALFSSHHRFYCLPEARKMKPHQKAFDFNLLQSKNFKIFEEKFNFPTSHPEKLLVLLIPDFLYGHTKYLTVFCGIIQFTHATQKTLSRPGN